jgi:hypothetical protein
VTAIEEFGLMKALDAPTTGSFLCVIEPIPQSERKRRKNLFLFIAQKPVDQR